jgi:molybdenum cofactor guanylyltransferase
MQRRGFILTGGRSSRLGQDKALLRLADRSIAEHLAAVIAKAACSATLVGAPQRYVHLGIPCIPDLQPGLGPLSGIEAALAHTQADHNLILACDLPGVDAELLARLFARAESEDVECVCVRDGTGVVHPLCAIYQRSCLAPVRAALASGKLRLMSLLETVSTDYVDTNESLANINTLADWNSFSCR